MQSCLSRFLETTAIEGSREAVDSHQGADERSRGRRHEDDSGKRSSESESNGGASQSRQSRIDYETVFGDSDGGEDQGG